MQKCSSERMPKHWSGLNLGFKVKNLQRKTNQKMIWPIQYHSVQAKELKAQTLLPQYQHEQQGLRLLERYVIVPIVSSWLMEFRLSSRLQGYIFFHISQDILGKGLWWSRKGFLGFLSFLGGQGFAIKVFSTFCKKQKKSQDFQQNLVPIF